MTHFFNRYQQLKNGSGTYNLSAASLMGLRFIIRGGIGYKNLMLLMQYVCCTYPPYNLWFKIAIMAFLS